MSLVGWLVDLSGNQFIQVEITSFTFPSVNNSSAISSAFQVIAMLLGNMQQSGLTLVLGSSLYHSSVFKAFFVLFVCVSMPCMHNLGVSPELVSVSMQNQGNPFFNALLSGIPQSLGSKGPFVQFLWLEHMFFSQIQTCVMWQSSMKWRPELKQEKERK